MSAFTDFFSLMECFTGKPPKSIAKTEINGYIVSTVNTPDMGYETAILKDNAYPVERYKDEESAKIGHDKWVENIRIESDLGPIKITRLGYGDSVPDQIMVVE